MTFVAIATYDLGKHGFWNFIPAMAIICCSGDILPGRILSPQRHVLVKQVRGPVILVRQEMLCLAGMTVADQNLQVAPRFVFLSLVHILFTLFLHNWVK